MKRFLQITMLLSMLLTACGVIPGLNPTATATVTLTPTATPQPTFTPTPTQTSTPTPTATPDVAATKAARATQAAASVLDDLKQSLGTDSGIPYHEGHLIWQQTDAVSINLAGPDDGFEAIGDNLSAGDFIFKSEVTWEATGLLVCGAAFRSETNIEKGKQYLFSFLRFSGLPAWAIEVFEFGRFKNSPTDVRFSSTVDQDNGATNEFILIAQGNEFTVYMNQNREGRYYDYSNQRMNGLFAFHASQSSGKGNCTFENSWIWSLDK